MSSEHSGSTRRGFLSGTLAASAYVWIPKRVNGYNAVEMRSTAMDNRAKAGISKWEIDTPALLVDLDKMEANIAKMQATLKKNNLPSRPHSKTHKTAAIAKYQIQTGSIGICCAKLTEAEAMIANGVDRIMMTTANPSVSKIKRAMAIRKAHPNFIQAVDYEQNARDLNDAAKAAGIVADVVIDVAVGTRSGIPAEGALALGQAIDKLPNLKLRGMLSYDGGVQHAKGFENRKARALKTIEPNVASYEMMKKAGLNMEIFSGGGSGTYNIMHMVPGFTDLQCGSYLFMDMQYIAIGSETGDEVYSDFAPSLTVVTTVLNNRFPERLTTDAGAKALTLNTPTPAVIGEPTMAYNAGSDEFGAIRFTQAPSKEYKIGDKLELIVPHCDPVVNEYNQMYGIRKGNVEVVWDVTGRGCSQ
jgi:D-serine deaminase-like pyridoxal phosphate-dependent protein